MCVVTTDHGEIRNEIDVDNLISGANSLTDVKSNYPNPKKIFREASMNLKECISNDKDVNAFIPENGKEVASSTKVLGHVLNVDTYTLSLKSTRSCVIGVIQTERTTLWNDHIGREVSMNDYLALSYVHEKKKTWIKKLLSEGQLLTTLKEIEAVVSSCPLVYVGDDVNSNITLTPCKLSSLNPNIGVPEIDCDLSNPTINPFASNRDRLLKIWKKGQRLLDLFWNMWRERTIR
ncbi:unnamed protein product [Mytilus coruscus]|uniref:DUF5641 domain-containing protein n=1 Tax=Mytilus coruscus TaxID=42192 RepID=A0A6J8CL30_MYTCO|nr:unnamed protein product [Mytilus coruscus]